MPFQSASKSFDAPTSASSVAGRPHRGVVVGAADAARRPPARSAIAARPWPSSRWWATGSASNISALPGRVDADAVAEHRHDVRLVDRDPVLDPVGEPLADERGVLGEAVDGVAVQPAARRPRAPAAGPSGRASPSAGCRARAARRPAGRRSRGPPGSAGREPVGLDPRPRDREAVAARARGAPSGRGPRRGGGSGRTRRRRSSRPTMLPRLVGEGVPDARALAVLGGRPLDLVRRSAGTEPEARWKQRVRHGDHCVGDRIVRRGLDRFSTRESGRQTRHSFSFGSSYDPERVSFGPLVALNDDLLARGRGTTRTSTRRRAGHLGGLRCSSPTRTRPARRSSRPASWRSPGPAAAPPTASARATAATRFVQMWLRPGEPGRRAGARTTTPGPERPGTRPSPAPTGLALDVPGATLAIADLAAGESPVRARRAAASTSSWSPARSPGRAWPSRSAAGDAFEITERARRLARSRPPCRPSCWSGRSG